MKQSESGFIAIMSVIILSVLLLAISFSLSTSGFFARANITDSESKEHSLALAESCAETALFKIASDGSYNPLNQLVSVGGDQCTIVSVSGNPKVITAKGTYQTAVTLIQVTAAPGNLSFTSWQEVPN